jgi:hypothetical protein
LVTVLYGQENKNLDLPSIGPWFIDKNCLPAHWLGQKYKNNILQEPINIIIIDKYSKTELEAVNKLVDACGKSKYEGEEGHSSGYFGLINDVLYSQIPKNKKIAFSNKEFFSTNNHGRIMGPCLYNGFYVFIGAFSQEAFKVTSKMHHAFLSFIIARDDFAKKMNDYGAYKIDSKYDLKNIIDDSNATTADHDGIAIVLIAQE